MDIKATIGQLTAERDKLDKAIQALQALEDSSGPAPRTTAPSAPRRRSTRRRATGSNGSRATNGTRSNGKALTPESVIGLVTADGVAASEIRGQTGGSADAVLRVLKQLESDGAVKRSGARRSTKWHLASR
jgi:hypothetical protein